MSKYYRETPNNYLYKRASYGDIYLKSYDAVTIYNLYKKYNRIDVNIVYEAILQSQDVDLAFKFLVENMPKLLSEQIINLIELIDSNYRSGSYYTIKRAFDKLNADDYVGVSYYLSKLAEHENSFKL